jgi:hypothetical protein
MDSLKGDCVGRRAGLAIADPERSCVTTLFTVTELLKSSFFAVPKMLPGAFIGLFDRGFMGVFSLQASSSSDKFSLAVAI